MVRHRWLWILLLPAVLMGSCDRIPGIVNGQFSWDATVTEMNLTGLNVAVENSLPTPGASYQLAVGAATILWQASGSAYSLDLVIKANPALTTEIIEVDFPTAGGPEKNLLFEFAADQLTVSELVATYPGSTF